jgi:hypothetical protein
MKTKKTKLMKFNFLMQSYFNLNKNHKDLNQKLFEKSINSKKPRNILCFCFIKDFIKI